MNKDKNFIDMNREGQAREIAEQVYEHYGTVLRPEYKGRLFEYIRDNIVKR